MLTRLALVSTLALGGLAACGGDDAEPRKASSESTVTMKLIAFRPENLTVPAGTTVTWRQTDAGVHTVTSGTVRQDGGTATAEPDGGFDSGQIATGDTYRRAFPDAGSFAYFCAVHPATMRGEITVT